MRSLFLMSQNDPFFTLSHPTTQAVPEANLFARRQVSYLHQLELPSLPPLSKILTEQDAKKPITETTTIDPSTTATTATAVLISPTATSYPTQQQQPQQQQSAQPQQSQGQQAQQQPASAHPPPPPQPHPLYIGDYTSSGPPTSAPSMDVATAAVAAAATADLFPTSTTIPVSLMDHSLPTMLPLYPSDPATAAAAMVAASAAAASAGEYIRYGDDDRRMRYPSESSTSSDKVYSFVAIPGTNHKKRPRRRYDEIERLYHCNWPGCTKAYGTLNHLNAHVSMQKHGTKRHPSEFKEMRKEWRRQKKEREAAKKAADEAMNKQQQQHQQQHHHQMMQAAAVAPYSFQPYNQLQPTMTLGGYY
ncbi:hypothetical protein EC973_000117 [Apophysomyces ossiformis]|uniref:C2H2-type domain-containing protein n=1 Tax=Apophysomyces ossiformis TaxID=679940 RepID=A0A8H7BWG5_9FUNG|nr:hypothetical protein EC973_000117 [Apophysomyces ossiformis]